MTNISNPIFHDEDKARQYLEAQRWPNGPFCPFCGQVDTVKALPAKGSMGKGWYHCKDCRKKFTVRVGTLYERSHVKLNKWLLATHLLCFSKKGMSAHQLHRMLGVTYKTAWFMAHRIREAMRPGKDEGPKRGPDQIVEADETFIGGKEKNRHRSKRAKKRLGGSWGKEPVFSLLERGGKVRSVHTPSVAASTLRPILVTQLDRKTRLMTDDAGQYRHMHKDFPHEVVNHGAGEYVRGDAHTNTVENYFSILKRGITGTYHHVSAQHLKRYVGEFDFRYNHRTGLGFEDMERMDMALKGIEGKRLTYRRIDCR